MGGYLFMKEGVTTTMKRRKGLGAVAPLMGCCLLLLYILDMLLFSLYTLSLSSPTLLLHHGGCLSEALPKSLATYTWRSKGGGVSGGSLLTLPHWNEGMEDVTEPYV
jgi:hypothetical protein